MTALPKHWPSSRRQGRRRASQKQATARQTTICRHCQQPKLAGFQCSNCKSD